ncbi:hypothetical protein HYW21_03405 [Candidatus Woesearchaeota archaeon]|nr:hypothetical protein [Candidatus Woesearchaeota archaeon]
MIKNQYYLNREIRETTPRKARKGLGTVTTAFFSYTAFALLVIIFFFIIALQTDTIAEQKKSYINTSNVLGSGLELHWDLTLLNYLRTPVTVDGEAMTMADLIVLWYHNPEKYEALLTSQSTEVLNQWTYHYIDPQFKNERIMAYAVWISEGPPVRGEIQSILLRLPSTQYKGEHCLMRGSLCQQAGGAYLPGSETKTIYVSILASRAAASTDEDK